MSNILWFELLKATYETLYMVCASGVAASLVGIPLGIILSSTRKNNLLANPTLHRLLAGVVNAFRSIPFIILLIAIIPFTRWLTGTSIGTQAAVVPLTIGAIPFIARLVENAVNEVPIGLTEAGKAMGGSAVQIILKILMPEALPGIVNAITVTLVSLVAYSAMAGAVGGGGLGDLAIRYGYQRFDLQVMIVTIIILIFLVQLLQYIGDFIVRWLGLVYH
jgi:D-methionine transport system permease protein